MYPINVKTAEPIPPKFCVGPHMTPEKVLNLKKKLVGKVKKKNFNAPILIGQSVKMLEGLKMTNFQDKSQKLNFTGERGRVNLDGCMDGCLNLLCKLVKDFSEHPFL